MTSYQYRKIYSASYGISLEDMKGYDVHHIDGNHENNRPENLKLLTPEEHAEIHQHEFVSWARKGSELGNAAFIERLKTKGPTEKELAYRKILGKRAKKGIHNQPHSEETKKRISQNKIEWHKNHKHSLLGKTTYEIKDPNGQKHIVSEGATSWCKKRGINLSNLRHRTHTKGYTLLKFYESK